LTTERRKAKRTRESYLSKSPEKRKIQLGNLFRGKTAERDTPFLRDPRNRDIRYFLENHYYLETGEPIKLEDWQLKYMINPVYPGNGKRPYSVVVWGLNKKQGKSTLSSGVGLFELLFSEALEPEVYSIASSRDQASIIYNKACRAVKRSPELNRVLKVYRNRIECPHNGGIFRALAADRDRAEGKSPSCLLCDEASISKWDLWIALLSGMIQREGSGQKPLALITSTAGANPASKFHKFFQRCELDKEPRTYYFWTGQNLASWITTEALAEAKIRYTRQEYDRYFRNLWVVSGDDSFVDQEDISRCLDHRLQPQYIGKRGIKYIVGVDIGLRGDRTACSVIHASGDFIILDAIRTFQGKPKKPVLFDEIMDHLTALHAKFYSPTFVIDTWQAEMLCQKLKAINYKVKEFAPTSSAMYHLAGNLYQLLHNGTLKFWEDEQLIDELLTVISVQKSSGIRIDHKSGQFSDITISLGMAAMELTKKPWWKRTGKPGALVGKRHYQGGVDIIPNPYFRGQTGQNIPQPAGSRYVDPEVYRQKLSPFDTRGSR